MASITDGTSTKTMLHYDAGRNLQVIEQLSTTGRSTRSFVVDSHSNVASLTPESGLPVAVLTGSGVDDHLAPADSAGGVTFGISDATNTTIATTDAAGVVWQQFAYEPYGQNNATSNAAYPFQFSGRLPVASNLLYYRNRYYHAKSARFLSEDPLGVAGSPVDLTVT